MRHWITSFRLWTTAWNMVPAPAVRKRRRRLERLDLVGADNDRLLAEAGLQALPQARPPGSVEVIGHDFQDGDVVPLKAAFRLPQPPSGAAGEGGQAAEALGQQPAE